MLDKLAKILFSTRLTAVLFIVFAIAMITGTLLDANAETSPTPYTRTLIYNAWWFEAIMLLFVINFVGNIFRYRLYKKEKWATFALHLAFIFILLGAGITRYNGFEGMMAIREGATESTFLSRDVYITALIDGDYKINGQDQRLPKAWKVDFSERLSNRFTKTAVYNKQPVTFKVEKFVEGAEQDVIPDNQGAGYLKIVEAGNSGPHSHLLKSGTVENIHNVLVALNKPTSGAINITETKSGLFINSPFKGEYMQMATGKQGVLVNDSLQPLLLRSRYIIGNMQLVFPKPVVKGVVGLAKKSKILKNDEDGIVLSVTSNGETKKIDLLGGQGTNNPFKKITVGGLDISLRYGAKVLQLPFQVKLNDFIAAKYPGTQKRYASFESKVTILDNKTDPFDYHIYMNHVLDHEGYRFFQSGFDPDEKGTILSVNHDQLGTWVTYFGYFMLYFGLMAILFAKNTRFDDLRNYLEKIKAKKKASLSIILFFLSMGITMAQHDTHQNHDLPSKAQIDSILKANITPKEHANEFGKLVIQDVGGRMMPVNTFASELLRKLSKHETYANFNANQLFLSMHESPLLWYNVPIIYLRKQETDSVKKIIGVPVSEKYVSLASFFTKNGLYKLAPYLENAYATTIPNGYQKKIIEADQRVNLLYNTVEGRSLKIFPVSGDENNKWISNVEYRTEGYTEKIKDSLYGNFINTGFKYYLYTLNEAKKTGDFTQANQILKSIKKTQQKQGASVMLSDKKISTEILYNKYDVFKKLFKWFMYAGSVLFVLLIIQIFKDSKGIRIAIKSFNAIIVALFVLHTIGLIVRWYISGHAPWSDAYESMIYVAWATMFFGLAFGRKSDLTIASTAFVTSMLLMIAHWSWMDPAIANLQPVLNSYWLMIHVAVIVASYGPFLLGFMLGIVCLLLMCFTNTDNKSKMDLNIKELTTINEMALTVGLVMLTIGNFLGGMWANESWGRYWGWDPKETWALISIMVYAFVVHMRLVPGLRGRWLFNLLAVVAISSIIFTYFGVNFYLSGLHSYQSGQQIASAQYIAIAFGFVAILGMFSYSKYKRFYTKK